MPQTWHHSRTLTTGDRRTYVAIDFQMPNDAARVEVTYAVHTDHPERCAIDIGLRDPAQWRGWTGSERRTIFVTPSHATPGYLLGPLAPGRWEVVLGLYDLPEGGCTVDLTITVEEAVARWLTGDLHAHTVHSDGRLTVPELCAFAVEQGLDYLAITDHNTVSQHRQEALNVPLLLIPGMEFTTYSGHANLLGPDPPPLDFRYESDDDFAEHFQAAHAAGMFVSVNHPSEADCGWEHTHDLPYDGIEIWNWAWNDRDAETLEHWQRQLTAGRRVIALGGSDFHGPIVPGEALPVVTRIFARERSAAAVLAGLRAGHVVVAQGVAAPSIDLTLAGAMIGDTVHATRDEATLSLCVNGGEGCLLRLISDHGIEWEHRIDVVNWLHRRPVATDRLFYRSELRATDDSQQPLAISNPIYLER